LRSWREPKTLIYAALCGLVFILALVIRMRAAMNDLWMDEIWSVELVGELHSALGVFTQTHHDNNHYLNSLFIYFLGQHGDWSGYRILSEAAGMGTIVLAWFIGLRRDRWTAFFSMFLVSFSYVAILYSSEARGYASLVFFCFLCFLILESFFEKPRWQMASWFSLSSVLGFTSHLTFLIFLAASLIWFWVRLIRLKMSPARVVAWTAGFYAIPFIYLGMLYVVDIRYLQIGGGTPIGVLDGYGTTLGWVLGGPNASWVQRVTGAITAIGVLAGLLILIKQRSDEWIFFAGVAVILPLSMPLFEHGTLHYVRYFIVAFGFMILLLGRVLGSLWQSRAVGKIICLLFLALFATLNAPNIERLFKYGRGQLSDAVRFMADNAKDHPITFGGQQDFRTKFMLSFYWRALMGDTEADYYDHENWPAAGPEWVIFHNESFTEPVPPGKHFTDKFGNWYELVRTYPTAPLSGVHLFLYRKIPKPGPA
jgi:hypothetical protein